VSEDHVSKRDDAGVNRWDGKGLQELTVAIFQRLGVPVGDARTAAASLIEADLMGIDSHGIAHLLWHPGYVKGLQRGWVNPTPVPVVALDGPSTAVLDGDGGMGVVVASAAQDLAIDKAAETGLGIGRMAMLRRPEPREGSPSTRTSG
jgi:LDH2 family malate/lactate/ureidoglycolate dehydrogenase